MLGISTYSLQIIRAQDVIFLWPKWQLKCSNAWKGCGEWGDKSQSETEKDEEYEEEGRRSTSGVRRKVIVLTSGSRRDNEAHF